MAFELKILNTPVHVGSFDFFDLMDSEARSATHGADVLAFQASSVGGDAADRVDLQTAA
ncbi:MAG: hypothetical protein AAF607_13865 [Pseudomonadota bacterium]